MQFLKRYLIPRLVQYIVVIFIGVTIIFIIPRLTPSDPIEEYLDHIRSQGQFLDPYVIEDLRETLEELYGLTGSVGEQYLAFWGRLFRGDFGPSFSAFPEPVISLIRRAMPWTIGLLAMATIMAWVLGSILGGLAGSFRRAGWAKALEVLAMTIRPIPYYIMALFLMILFAYVVPIFPLAGGYSVGMKPSFSWRFVGDVIHHGMLPALSLMVLGVGTWFLTMRSVTSNVVGEDYVTYAEAAGLPKSKIIFGYTIRNAILPQITGLAMSLGMIFGGALITETVFSYPGIGTLLYNAIHGGDYNLIMGVAVFSVVGIATAVLVIDLVYPLFDPRVRQR